MDMNYILIWFVLFSCGLYIFVYAKLQLKRETSEKFSGWFFVLSAVLGITIVMIFLSPGKAGLIGGLLWFIFVFLPLLCNKLIDRFLAKEDFDKAGIVARISALLHPADNIKKMPGLIYSLKMVQQGEINKAAALVEKYRNLNSPIDRFAHTYLLGRSGQFKELIEWVQQNFGEQNLHRYLDLLPRYMEALGETGEIKKMIDLYLMYTERMSKLYFSPLLPICRLYIFAFTGRKELVQQLLSGKLSPLSTDKKKFWLATAARASGKGDEAREEFTALLESPSYSIRLRSQMRLHSPLDAAAEEFESEIERITRQVTLTIKEEQKYKNPLGHRAYRKKAYATYALMGVILFFFLLELHYGINPRSLTRLGAIYKFYSQQGEWWRLITSMFMHFDFNHLILNLFGLFIIGPYVEKSAGRFFFVVIYLLSGLGSMYLAALLTPQPVLILMGASGCIMGLLGAMSYLLFLGYKQEKSKIAKKSFYLVVLIFAFQVIFDIITPNISFIAHLSGFVFGLVITGLVLSLKRAKPAPATKK